MKAWLYAEDHAKSIKFPYRIVFERNQAVEMTENNAHEVMRGAEGQNPEYTWELVKVHGRNMYVVEGTRKK